MKNRSTLLGLSLATVIMAVTAHAPAAIIATYNFAANNDSADTEPNSVAGIFVYNTSGVRSSSSQTAVKTYAMVTASSQVTSLIQNESFEFTVTPASGDALHLTSLTFLSAVNISGPTSTTFSGAFFVRSSLDGYASDLAFYSQAYNDTPTYMPRTVNLASPTFQGLDSAVTFRIYVYETGASTATFDALRLDDVVLNGDVLAVPEPASMSLIALGSLAMLWRSPRPRR